MRGKAHNTPARYAAVHTTHLPGARHCTQHTCQVRGIDGEAPRIENGQQVETCEHIVLVFLLPCDVHLTALLAKQRHLVGLSTELLHPGDQPLLVEL